MNNRFLFNDKYYKTEIARKSKNGKNIKGYYLCGGYLKVKVKEHPAQDKRGYVLFHRLVMEDKLNRYLLEDEYIHHKDGNKLNNDIENLELMYSYEHAKEHCNSRERNNFGQFICTDEDLNNIKIRLFNKDRGDIKEYSLSKLIYTKFKRNCFEYRGMSTGLKDKNGKLIYEGDIVKYAEFDWTDFSFKDWETEIAQVVWGNTYDNYYPAFDLKDTDFDGTNAFAYLFNEGWTVEVIGNIYENKSLLESEG